MSESLRDLVVSLSLNSDNFTRNIKSVNKQIQEAESYFKLAASGQENFEKSMEGSQQKLAMLQRKLELQKNVVDQYTGALKAANDKLQETYARQQDYTQRLAQAQSVQASLKVAVISASDAYERYRTTLGDSNSATIEAKANMEASVREYIEASSNVELLSGQCDALSRSMQNAADGVSTAQTNLNKANAAIKDTEKSVADCERQIAFFGSGWEAATLKMVSANNAIASSGKKMQLAESEFRVASAGIKDVDKSVEAMAARLTLLTAKQNEQNHTLAEYENKLEAANEQLRAAQGLRDPEKIRQATDAVTEAETGLNNATAAIIETESSIASCKQELDFLRSSWNMAAGQIDQANTAISSSGKKIELAESRFKLASAGIKDVDKSTEAMSAKLVFLNEKQDEQNKALVAYEQRLGAAKLQLEAAQKLNDPQRIQQATDAVLEAEKALNEAKAAVKATSAEIKDAQKNLYTLQSSWTKTGESLEAFSKRCDKASKTIGRVGKVLTASLTTPIVALGTNAVKSSIEFESAFTGVRKTVDATEEEFGYLEQVIKRMSTEIASSTTEIAGVMEVAGQLGIQTDALEEFTRVMIDLGNSTDIVSTEAAPALAKFANVMNMDQSKFGNLGSTLVQLGNNFATTESAIMEMSQRLAGAGHQVGLSEAEVLGFATALSSVGIEAQMGGSAFSKALAKMEVASATGGEELANFAAVCGLTEKQFVQLWDSNPAQVFQYFIQGLAHLDDEGISAIQVLNDIGIGEIRLRDTLLRSVNATELFTNAQIMAKQAWREDVALTTEAGKRYATTASRLENLKNKATIFAQQIGDDLNPTIQSLIDGANDLIEDFMALDEAERMNIIQTAAVVASIGPALVGIAGVTKGISIVSKVLSVASLSLGKLSAAVKLAGGGFSGFMTVLASSPAAMLAVGAAAVAGAVYLYDIASGAKAAREALAGMNETAQKWKDNEAQTFYNRKGAGLSFFGMTEEAFIDSGKSIKRTADAWFSGVLDVWTAKKARTNKVIKQYTDAFKEGTQEVRQALQDRQKDANDAGYTTLAEQMQSDLNELDRIDKEVTKLLKKRNRGVMTEEEQIQLQDLINTRNAIEVKYHLVEENGDAEGFDTIQKKLEAAKSRAAARGETLGVDQYENAMTAGAQGMATMIAQIDEEYDKEWALIQLITDENEKRAAMEALNQKYNAQRLAAAEEYASFMTGVIGNVWNSTDVQSAKNDVQSLYDLLMEYEEAGRLGDKDKQNSLLTQMANLTDSMDEGQLVTYVGLLTQVQSLMDSGLGIEEVNAILGTDVSPLLSQLAALQSFFKLNSSSLQGLFQMFGVALPEEMLTLTADLNMEDAYNRWREFASNPGAITTEAVVQNMEDKGAVEQASITVSATVDKLINAESGDGKFSISGVTLYVNSIIPELDPDGEEVTIDDVTGVVTALQTVEDPSVYTLDDLAGIVSSYSDDGVDLSNLSVMQIKAIITGYEDLTSGKATSSSAFSKKVVEGWKNAGVDVTKINKDHVRAFSSVVSEASGMNEEDLTVGITAEIDEYTEAENAVKPTPKISAQIQLDNYDLMALRSFQRQFNGTITNTGKLGDYYNDPMDAFGRRDVKYHSWYGKEIDKGRVNQEKLTTEDFVALDNDGTLHVFITPEVSGSKAAVEQMNKKVAVEDQLGVTGLGKSIGLLPTSTLGYVTLAMERLKKYQSGDFWNFLEFGFDNKLLNQSLETDFNTERVAGLSTYVAEVVTALQNGSEVSEEDFANMQLIVDFLKQLDMTDTGENISAGIADGMTSAGWTTDAESVATDLESALNGAFEIHSPSRRMMPIGDYIAQGIGAGATAYPFSAEAGTVASMVQNALAGSMRPSAFRSIGFNASAGLANGIRSGQSSIISAMREAARAAVNVAKSELQIHSPSRVFRDEVGQMAMRGFGEGIMQETKVQEKTIRNAAQYLTESAREGAIVPGTSVSQRTYNNTSTVDVTGNNFYVRDEQDAHLLAVEIAALTKKRQRGRGLRMA